MGPSSSSGSVWVFAGLDVIHEPGPTSAADRVLPNLEDLAIEQLTLATGCAAASFRQGERPAAVLGHSFGELAALVACGSLAQADAEHLGALRARAMSSLCDASTGMVAVVGVPADLVDAAIVGLTAAGHELVVTAWNSPTQTVVGGRLGALAALRERFPAPARIRAVGPPVVAHSAAMNPVRAALQDELASTSVSTPSVPVYLASTVTSTMSAVAVRESLLASVTTPVRWRQAVLAVLKDGYRAFSEIGSAGRPRLLGVVADIAAIDCPTIPAPALWWLAEPSARVPGEPFVPRRRPIRATR